MYSAIPIHQDFKTIVYYIDIILSNPYEIFPVFIAAAVENILPINCAWIAQW